MSDNVTKTQETTATLTVEQLEQIIRKVVREELMEFTTQEFFDLDKDSPLYDDLADIFEREKTNQLKWFSHTDVWNE
jgi:hypothetical protein